LVISGVAAIKEPAIRQASGESTCIDCHKGIAHQLPDMKGVEGF
jgi:cytochrome c-type protein NapC